jgi:putative transcriptional regulator
MTGDLSLDDLLVAHAAGKLAEPVALAVATHLALSPASRRRYARYEAVGGFLLEDLPEEALAPDAWSRLAARLDEPEVQPARSQPSAAVRVPAPLRDYLPESLDAMRWRHYGNISEADLAIAVQGYRARLFRLKAGRGVPRHTHGGSELTVVLEGAFSDERGHYGRGDLAIADGTVDHRPVADEGLDCLCLAVTDAPLRLTGPIARFLNPFLRL